MEYKNLKASILGLTGILLLFDLEYPEWEYSLKIFLAGICLFLADIIVNTKK